MSELMAIESIAEEYAKLLGYFTRTRVPFKRKVGLPDLDVLGVHPKTKRTIVIECKAWGGPEDYRSFNGRKDWFKEMFKRIIDNWSFFRRSKINKTKWCLSKLDEIWLVIPGYCDDKLEIQTALSKELRCDIKITPIHELLLNIMLEVKQDKDIRRKRYSNPALEFCRWLLRSYDKGQLNLIDLDLELKGKRQTYDILKKNYFRECLRAVKRNVEKRGEGVNTRINALKILSKVGKGRLPELAKSGKEKGYESKQSRIRVGLETWERLGMVNRNNSGEFSIGGSFEKIIKDELKKLRE
jgi:hypothetical protein